MSVNVQQKFLCSSAMSRGEILQRMMRLQTEINKLHLLYQQQAQNTFSEEIQHVNCTKVPEDCYNIPAVDQIIPVVSKSIPVTDDSIPVNCQQIPETIQSILVIGQSIQTNIPVKNQSKRLSNRSFENESFFRSSGFFNPDRIFDHYKGKNNRDIPRWPVAKFLWWEEEVTSRNKFSLASWLWFDRPPEKQDWNMWKRNLFYWKMWNRKILERQFFFKPENLS